ncbi:unnamed protein product [Rotaria magnacalcarata]|uniref:Polymerase nucleotidyl transferase domain-containing protein n=4 Tax=Rotaria magnacalcarata TaxID=392030 RepID=A0A814JCM6_9BILA|nr:unnamed protein product [Rotaria magnacalcarata]CAF2123183.1 unnamed protein product [Rotaria magnacalcarata]
MEGIVSSIIKELKLDDNQITNIFNYGSWVYGTNHEKSDRDFLIIMNIEGKRLRFKEDFDYFHSFKLHRINKYDVTIHTCQNFELLLEKNYMLAVECLFYPSEFILRNNIDYKTIYLSKYYNPLRIKQVAFYENKESFKYIIDNEQNGSYFYQQRSKTNLTIDQFVCDAIPTTTLDEDRVLKYLFHGVRYLDIGEQLIRTKSIYDFKRASYVLFEMKNIYIENNKDIDFVVDYIKTKGKEYKTKLNELIKTNTIDDAFKVHITVDHREMEKLLNVCKINKLKPIFIHLQNGNNPQQLMTSSSHVGTFPEIVEQMKIFADLQFKDLNIIRLKIKSSASHKGVPEENVDKLFWSQKSNYFEFRYKIYVSSKSQLGRLNALCIQQNLCLAFNAFETKSTYERYYIATMRLFHTGRKNAYVTNNYILQSLTRNDFSPVEVENEFVVYDSNINLDSGWGETIPKSLQSNSSVTKPSAKYRIGFKNRKYFPRSS